MKTLRIVKKAVGEKPEVIEIENSLEKMKEHVGGGLIDTVRLGADIVLVIDDCGKLNGSEPNFDLVHDVIMGDCFFVSEGFIDGEIDFKSLTDEQIELIMDGTIDFESEPKNEPDTTITFISF